MGFPSGSSGKESACNAGDTGEAGSIPIPGGGNGSHSSVLAWKIPRRGGPVGYSPWGLIDVDLTEHAHTQII